MVQWEVCLYAWALRVCVCARAVLFCLLCVWINWAWMMMMMMMVRTAMFIARLVKKIYILPACRAWIVTICSPTPAPAGSRSHPVFWFPSLLWVKHWVVDRCTFYRLLNAYVFNVSAPQMPFFLSERDSVISVCQTWHVLSSSLHLFNDPDIAPEHTYCTVGQSLSSHGQGPALLINHCACEALCRYDCITWEFGVL